MRKIIIILIILAVVSTLITGCATERQLQVVDRIKRDTIYINKVEDLRGYLALLAACTTAKEIGEVVAIMAEKEPRLTKEEICKSRFISLLPPLAPKVTEGIKVDNLRIHIDNAVEAHKRARKAQSGMAKE